MEHRRISGMVAVGDLTGGSSWTRRARAPLAVTAVVIGALFWAAPWSLEVKARAILHGLCAQRPSHTFRLGEQLLPLDARMTGIYGGFLIAFVWLVVRGRLRAFRLPPRGILALLALFVASMALDGGNSLLVDLGLPSLYRPDNRLRLVTGVLTGTALAVILGFLLATTLWRRGEWGKAGIERPRDLAAIALFQAPFAALVGSGAGSLYAPLAVMLIVAATVVVSAMILVVVLLLRRKDQSFEGMADLQGWLAAALVLGVSVMALLAGGRFLLERGLGLPLLT